MDNLLEIAKMYDPEEDIAPSEKRNKVAGSWGMKLADAILEEYEYDFTKWTMFKKISTLTEESYKQQHSGK